MGASLLCIRIWIHKSNVPLVWFYTVIRLLFWCYATSMASICPSVRNVIVITYCNKKWKWVHDRIDWSLGYLHAEANPDRNIP